MLVWGHDGLSLGQRQPEYTGNNLFLILFFFVFFFWFFSSISRFFFLVSACGIQCTSHGSGSQLLYPKQANYVHASCNSTCAPSNRCQGAITCRGHSSRYDNSAAGAGRSCGRSFFEYRISGRRMCVPPCCDVCFMSQAKKFAFSVGPRNGIHTPIEACVHLLTLEIAN